MIVNNQVAGAAVHQPHAAIPAVRADAGVRIRETRFDDFEQIALLDHRYGMESKDRDEWVRLWIGNPAYIANRQSWPLGWVLEADNGTIVGYIGNIPMWYQFWGTRLLAAIARGWVVDSEYRSRSFLLVTRYFKQAGVDLFLTNTAGPVAARTFRAFGGFSPPGDTWDKSLYWVTNYRGFVSAVISKLGHRIPRSLTPALAGGLFCADAIRGRRFCSSFLSVEPEWCTSFDSRFDEFWGALQGGSKSLMAVRSRDVLDWRFGEALRKGRAWVVSMCDGPRILAYAIFVRADNPVHNLTRMTLADLQVLDRKYSYIQPMLASAYRRCKQERIHVLESIGFSEEKRAALTELMPFTRTPQLGSYCCKVRNSDLASALRDQAVWDPSCLDGDACL
ncbi:MAG: hypothetical protein ACE14M_09190 [Terriglobales bacterium]